MISSAGIYAAAACHIPFLAKCAFYRWISANTSAFSGPPNFILHTKLGLYTKSDLAAASLRVPTEPREAFLGWTGDTLTGVAILDFSEWTPFGFTNAVAFPLVPVLIGWTRGEGFFIALAAAEGEVDPFLEFGGAETFG